MPRLNHAVRLIDNEKARAPHTQCKSIVVLDHVPQPTGRRHHNMGSAMLQQHPLLLLNRHATAYGRNVRKASARLYHCTDVRTHLQCKFTRGRQDKALQ